MSTPLTTAEVTAVKVASDTAAQAIKVAQAYQAKLDKAPKPVAPELTKAAAEVLVDTRWVQTADLEKVATALADPTFVLNMLTQMAQKSAEELAKHKKTPSTDNGVVVANQKAASAAGTKTEYVDPTALRWNEKMSSYRQTMGL